MSTEEEGRGINKSAVSSIFSWAFWITIFFMFSITAGLYYSIDQDDLSERSTTSSPDGADLPFPQVPESGYEIQTSALQTHFGRAATETTASINGGSLIDVGVEALYAPAYAAIDPYLNHHYSIYGSYAELYAAGKDKLGDEIQGKLFPGHEQRLNSLVEQIDLAYNAEFQRNLDQSINQDLPPGVSKNDLSNITLVIIQDTMVRAITSAPMSSVAAVTGALAAKAISQKIGAQLFGALTVKTVTKVASKPVVSFLAGVGVGAAGGTFFGPIGTVVGGIGGGIATWFAVDKVFIEVDEYLNRESFKNQLVAMIDESKEDTRRELKSLVQKKGNQIQQFTMRELMER
ncbi:MAG: hypothetical protein Q8L20_03240 [Gammaproteobacteria bacterium]|nr:hypothetical protein [Gammaproteobacteria bacterium]